MRDIKIGNVIFGEDNLGIIAGPCVIENRDHSLEMSYAIKGVSEDIGIPIIFKSSFDKANRTSIKSFRGPGIEDGMRILSDVKTMRLSQRYNFVKMRTAQELNTNSLCRMSLFRAP